MLWPYPLNYTSLKTRSYKAQRVPSFPKAEGGRARVCTLILLRQTATICETRGPHASPQTHSRVLRAVLPSLSFSGCQMA